jgi:hypothetical protein
MPLFMTIINKPWDYTFYEKSNLFYLSVMCGSVAIFEIVIELSSDETILFKNEGLDYIEKLAKQIQYSPSIFYARNVPKDSLS